MATGDFGRGKTIFVLAVVIGCFAILWPKIFYPMLTASLNPSAEDGEQCCDVIFVKDTNAHKILNEICANILRKEKESLSSPDEQTSKIKTTIPPKSPVLSANLCRNEILKTCGVDVVYLIKDNPAISKGYKESLNQLRTFNTSQCMKTNYGVDFFEEIGLPRSRKAKTDSQPSHMRPERPLHFRPDMMHPALREKGRAIHSPLPQRTIEKEARPGPMPGVRPPIGGSGHVATPKGGGTMGIIMPIYTIGIVVFFFYTIMKILFRKSEDDKPECPVPVPVPPQLKDFGMNPEHRKYVFTEEYVDKSERSMKDQLSKPERDLGIKRRPAGSKARSGDARSRLENEPEQMAEQTIATETQYDINTRTSSESASATATSPGEASTLAWLNYELPGDSSSPAFQNEFLLPQPPPSSTSSSAITSKSIESQPPTPTTKPPTTRSAKALLEFKPKTQSLDIATKAVPETSSSRIKARPLDLKSKTQSLDITNKPDTTPHLLQLPKLLESPPITKPKLVPDPKILEDFEALAAEILPDDFESVATSFDDIYLKAQSEFGGLRLSLSPLPSLSTTPTRSLTPEPEPVSISQESVATKASPSLTTNITTKPDLGVVSERTSSLSSDSLEKQGDDRNNALAEEITSASATLVEGTAKSIINPCELKQEPETEHETAELLEPPAFIPPEPAVVASSPEGISEEEAALAELLDSEIEGVLDTIKEAGEILADLVEEQNDKCHKVALGLDTQEEAQDIFIQVPTTTETQASAEANKQPIIIVVDDSSQTVKDWAMLSPGRVEFEEVTESPTTDEVKTVPNVEEEFSSVDLQRSESEKLINQDKPVEIFSEESQNVEIAETAQNIAVELDSDSSNIKTDSETVPCEETDIQVQKDSGEPVIVQDQKESQISLSDKLIDIESDPLETPTNMDLSNKELSSEITQNDADMKSLLLQENPITSVVEDSLAETQGDIIRENIILESLVKMDSDSKQEKDIQAAADKITCRIIEKALESVLLAEQLNKSQSPVEIVTAPEPKLDSCSTPAISEGDLTPKNIVTIQESACKISSDIISDALNSCKLGFTESEILSKVDSLKILEPELLTSPIADDILAHYTKDDNSQLITEISSNSSTPKRNTDEDGSNAGFVVGSAEQIEIPTNNLISPLILEESSDVESLPSVTTPESPTIASLIAAAHGAFALTPEVATVKVEEIQQEQQQPLQSESEEISGCVDEGPMIEIMPTIDETDEKPGETSVDEEPTSKSDTDLTSSSISQNTVISTEILLPLEETKQGQVSDNSSSSIISPVEEIQAKITSPLGNDVVVVPEPQIPASDTTIETTVEIADIKKESIHIDQVEEPLIREENKSETSEEKETPIISQEIQTPMAETESVSLQEPEVENQAQIQISESEIPTVEKRKEESSTEVKEVESPPESPIAPIPVEESIVESQSTTEASDSMPQTLIESIAIESINNLADVLSEKPLEESSKVTLKEETQLEQTESENELSPEVVTATEKPVEIIAEAEIVTQTETVSVEEPKELSTLSSENIIRETEPKAAEDIKAVEVANLEIKATTEVLEVADLSRNEAMPTEEKPAVDDIVIQTTDQTSPEKAEQDTDTMQKVPVSDWVIDSTPSEVQLDAPNETLIKDSAKGSADTISETTSLVEESIKPVETAAEISSPVEEVVKPCESIPVESAKPTETILEISSSTVESVKSPDISSPEDETIKSMTEPTLEISAPVVESVKPAETASETLLLEPEEKAETNIALDSTPTVTSVSISDPITAVESEPVEKTDLDKKPENQEELNKNSETEIISSSVTVDAKDSQETESTDISDLAAHDDILETKPGSPIAQDITTEKDVLKTVVGLGSSETESAITEVSTSSEIKETSPVSPEQSTTSLVVDSANIIPEIPKSVETAVVELELVTPADTSSSETCKIPVVESVDLVVSSPALTTAIAVAVVVEDPITASLDETAAGQVILVVENESEATGTAVKAGMDEVGDDANVDDAEILALTSDTDVESQVVTLDPTASDEFIDISTPRVLETESSDTQSTTVKEISSSSNLDGPSVPETQRDTQTTSSTTPPAVDMKDSSATCQDSISTIDQAGAQDSKESGHRDRDARDIEIDMLRKRLEETEAAMERIVAQMGSVSDRISPTILAQVLKAQGVLKDELAKSPEQTAVPKSKSEEETPEQVQSQEGKSKKRVQIELPKKDQTSEEEEEDEEESSSFARPPTPPRTVSIKPKQSAAAAIAAAKAAANSSSGGVSVVGFEESFALESGKKWNERSPTPTNRVSSPISRSPRPPTPPEDIPSIFLEGPMPASANQLRVSDPQIEIEGEEGDYDDDDYDSVSAPVILSGKVTLSVISGAADDITEAPSVSMDDHAKADRDPKDGTKKAAASSKQGGASKNVQKSSKASSPDMDEYEVIAKGGFIDPDRDDDADLTYYSTATDAEADLGGDGTAADISQMESEDGKQDDILDDDEEEEEEEEEEDEE